MDRRLLLLSGLAIAVAARPVWAQPADGAPTDDPYATPNDRYNGRNGAPPAPDRYDTAPQPPAGTDDAARTLNDQPQPRGDQRYTDNGYGPAGPPAQPYNQHELSDRLSDFMGVTAENAGRAIEKTFSDHGSPTAYIAGEEGSGAFFFGARYGQGLMYMRDRPAMPVFWQGPNAGFDIGGNASRVFTLCYDLAYPDAIFRRFPGVEGAAYLVGGMGINYQRADGITLAPIRAGVGLRLGANVGYLAYSRKRNIVPL